LESGVGYVTNDRHKEGIVQEMSIKHNISLMILKKLRKRRFFLDFSKEKEVADTYFDALKIKANSLEQQVNALSGGNQQKVVVAKILSSKPRLLILDEPTIGIDIKSREEILSIVNEISNQGVSVLYLTNDYNELTRISDRFLFFNEGKITNDMMNEGLQAEDLIKIRDK
jgi:ABC-type sugar transport system ATPase subunit